MSKKQKSPFVLMTDADGFAEMTRPAFVVLSITKQEVESRNWTSALERLLVLCETAENAQLYRESLFINVIGYDQDQRELPEIPEVRGYFASLSQAWPHWLWFLHRQGGGVNLLMSLLCPVKIHRDAGKFGVEFIDVQQFSAVLNDLLERSSSMFDAFNIPVADFESSVDSAMESLHGS